MSEMSKKIKYASPYICLYSWANFRNDGAFANKKAYVPVHRPVTRKLSAQMANKQPKLMLQKTEPESVPSKWESKDCILVDAEDCDEPVPMFVQHTEAMMEEIDRMDSEIEMEVVAEDLNRYR